jgi:hypothetical protein
VFDVCVCVCVFVFVFEWLTRIYSARTGIVEGVCFEGRGCSRGWKYYSDELHDLYWALNGGGWWTERQCEWWDKRIRQEKLKVNKNIWVWKPERKREVGRSRPTWDFKDNMMNCTYRITIPVTFRFVKCKFFLRYVMEHTFQWGLKSFNVLENLSECHKVCWSPESLGVCTLN